MRRAYLDYNATAPLREAARAAMMAAMSETGNASSVHAEGRAARRRREDAREKVAALVGAKPEMVVFTAGGTEANNLALKGAFRAGLVDGLVVSAIEHPSVLETAAGCGCPVRVVPVTPDGVVDLAILETVLATHAGRALVSIMMANNETGAMQPWREIAALARKYGALLHSDAVQAAGRVRLAWPILDADMLSVSGHKIGGPQGAGALVMREDLAIAPHLDGGGQERRLRAGTENIAAIAGFGAAAAEASAGLADMERVHALRGRLEAAIVAQTPNAVIFAAGVDRLANTTCFACPGLSAQLLLMALDLDGLAVSSGSACASGKVGRSHVLAAMGVGEALIGGAIRASLGWATTEEDIDLFAIAYGRLVNRNRNTLAA